MDDINQHSEDMILAVEIIRQLENLNYQPETILQAMIYICRDSLGKLSERERQQWQERLIAELTQ
ncbi:hypothetical protein [Endozoicomonas sp. 4G]|uniref:hypothetical protein n=1 Tax=Endozoicomonas sp. 4G TaxID=2872754 RepID=UPI0020788C75|nr:hypothetical protein [Endozoicomonas sp. 4G]